MVEDNAINVIYLDKKLYERRCNDYIMQIDFKKSICSFDFLNKETCNFAIECSFIKKDKEIILAYNYDKEIKKIIIIMKGE